MSISEELRAVMSHLPTGVTVISTRDAAGAPTGTTANAVTSVSLEPPLLLVSLAHDSETLAAIRASGAFAVNVLAEHQHTISSRFARKGANKAEGAELVDDAAGAPYLADSVALLRCAVDRLIEVGDHELVIGEVVGLQTAAAELRPLLFFRGRYSRLHDEDGEASSGAPGGPRRRR